MQTKNRIGIAARIVVALAAIPFCMACLCNTPILGPCTTTNNNTSGGCTTKTILSGTFALNTTIAAPGTLNVCTSNTATPPATVQTFNALAGAAVSLSAQGPTTNSRPQIIVVDILMNVVANTGPTPVTQTNTTSFVPSASNVFEMFVIECQTGVTGNYVLNATQCQ